MVATATPAAPPRTSKEKLAEAGFLGTLEEITEGVKNFPVTQRKPSSATTTTVHPSNEQRESSLFNQNPTQTDSPLLAPFPAPAPSSSHKRSLSAPATRAPLPHEMNRNLLHGAPPHGPLSSPYGSHDTRSGSGGSSNPPKQSTAPPGGINLKKAAVRVARPAGPAPRTPTRAEAPAPPVTAAPKVEDGHTLPIPTAGGPSTSSLEEAISSITKEEAALEELFARLDTPSMSASKASKKESVTLANYTADSTNASKSFPPGVQVQQPNSPGARLAKKEADNTNAGMAFPSGTRVAMAPRKGALVSIKEESTDEVETQPASAKSSFNMGVSPHPEEQMTENLSGADPKGPSIQDLEREYVLKAAEYLASLPSDIGPTAETIKNVTIKLRRPYAPSAILEPDVVQVLKARYVDAVVIFVNDINKGEKTVTKEHIGEILIDGNGNFLHLCAVLADQDLISVENIDQVAGLSKAVEGVLPDNEDTKPATPPLATTSKDPLGGMTSWPTRQKRENAPKCRTCLITGLPENMSVNKLQALVWGGRIESLQLPKPGSGKAVIRFFTSEACQQYFDATENGITIPGSETVVFVQKAEGPNSVNDVLAACTEGDATRCVRAYDADEDWGDVVLMKLATRAKGGQPKREVDTIKRGKTARGRSFIEFRFANVYAALQFKRELTDDQEWEHCTIGYAPDPCETAHGVHIKDEGEKEKASGFF